MSLKSIFNTMKNQGVVIPAIDNYLITIGEDEDRGHGMNSPSGVSTCPLSQWRTRKGIRKDGFIEPRTRRIFNNGDHTHDRLQEYLEKAGILLMREVPVWNPKLEILGHTDGILDLGDTELGILEIKSINSNGFTKLIDAKEEHKEQAQVYMFALEKFRKDIHKKCKNKMQFIKYRKRTLATFVKLLNTFVIAGKKFTKEEKIAFQIENMTKALNLLWGSKKPIHTIIVLYENKDNQELKEFTVKWDDIMVSEITNRYKNVNHYVREDKEPDRPKEATSKSCATCRWCNFQLKCWH